MFYRKENVMFRPMGRLFLALAVAGGLLLLAPLFKAANIGGVAWAQTQDVFNSSYFDDTVGGGTVSITNTTSLSTVCALIYVFRSDEQLEECCGCPVSHSAGLLTIRIATQLNPATEEPGGVSSVGFNSHSPFSAPFWNTLTDNPYDDTFLPRGVIKIESSLPNGTSSTPAPFSICDPTSPPTLVDALREYATAFQTSEFEGAPVNFTFEGGVGGENDDDIEGVTEHKFAGGPDPTLSDEAAFLQDRCNFIVREGSGKGVCGCGFGV